MNAGGYTTAQLVVLRDLAKGTFVRLPARMGLIARQEDRNANRRRAGQTRTLWSLRNRGLIDYSQIANAYLITPAGREAIGAEENPE